MLWINEVIPEKKKIGLQFRVQICAELVIDTSQVSVFSGQIHVALNIL